MRDTTQAMLAALPSFVLKHADARPGLARPFAIDYEGSRWAVATDGRRLLAVRGDHGLPLWNEAEPKAPDAVKVLVRPSVTPVPVSIAALREFAGVPTNTTEDCDNCDGEGVVECQGCDGDGGDDCHCHCGHVHEAQCGTCCGAGELPCPTCKPHEQPQMRPSRIGGSLFCRNIIGRATAALPDVPAMWAQDRVDGPAWLFGDNWIVLLMPMRDMGETDVPVFDLPALATAVEVPS